MLKTQVYLTEAQNTGIKSLAYSSGVKQSEIIRKAIDRFLEIQKGFNWKESLKAAKGMWADRKEVINEFRDIRSELDRK